MVTRSALLGTIFGVVLFACQNDEAIDELQIKNSIRAVLDAQVQAWNKGNIEKYMEGYSKADSLRFASGGDVFYGWQTTLERYKKKYSDKEAMGVLTFSKIDIKIIYADAAFVFGKWRLERRADHPWGLFTLLFRKTDVGWRIVHDHTSSADE